jgi:hypothetical protein
VWHLRCLTILKQKGFTMKIAFSLIALVAAMPATAEESRQLDAHEHGVGTLNIAIEGTNVAMEFHAPGADLAAIDAAVAILGAPLELFVLPDAASCSVVDAQAELEGEDEHDDHAEDDHNDAGDEDHEDHADEAGHTEFHAEYILTCDSPDALTGITFAYFEAFPNAQEVEVQIITATGAQAFEVERDAPVLNLER